MTWTMTRGLMDFSFSSRVVLSVMSKNRASSVVRFSKMTRSGRSLPRISVSTWGRTHCGSRRSETPGGRDCLLDASMIV